jgi:hypothetical protein
MAGTKVAPKAPKAPAPKTPARSSTVSKPKTTTPVKKPTTPVGTGNANANRGADRFSPSGELKKGDTNGNSSRVNSIVDALNADNLPDTNPAAANAATAPDPNQPFTKPDGTQVTPLEGGARQEVRTNSGPTFEAKTTQTFRPDGTKANHTFEHNRAASASERERDVNGTRFFGSMGHDNPQMLVDDLYPRTTGRRGRGGSNKPKPAPVDQSVGQIRSTTHDDKGKVTGTRVTDTHSWEKKDGSEKVTRFQTKGEADRWELEKHNKDGSWARQRFVEGTDDTWVDRKSKKDGWDIQSHESQTPDLAKQNRPSGVGQASVSDKAKVEVAKKEGGSVSDIKAKLGKDFDRLMKESPEFRQAMEGLDGQKLDLTEVKKEETFTDRERYKSGRRSHVRSKERTEFEHSLGFNSADGGSGILSRDAKDGGWSFGFQDADGKRLASVAGVDENGDKFRYGTNQVGSSNPVKTASQIVEGGKHASTARRAAALSSMRRIARGSHTENLAQLKNTAAGHKQTAGRLGKVGKVLGPAAESVATFFDAKNAFDQFSKGNTAGGVHSSINALGSAGMAAYGGASLAGSSSQLATKIAAGGKMLGGLGAGYQVLSGLHSVANGDNGGFFDMASGGGTIAALMGAGPVGWGIAVGGAVGGAVYRHLDETGIATTQI